MSDVFLKPIIKYVVFIRDHILWMAPNQEFPSDQDIASIQPYVRKRFDLGLFGNTYYYCAELDEEAFIPTSLQALSLRNTLSFLPDQRYGIAVKAYSILNWDKNHQYCGRCGGATQPKLKGYERMCERCELGFFPRISPSIIVLIKNYDHLLLARGLHHPPGVYGLIAGFVEVGESLEEAVHREVQEEVGLKIQNLTYVCSQPWPFPDSLMMAFTAEYAGGDIMIDPEEIEEAGWYKYDDLPGRPSMALSISSMLINAFVESFD